MPVFIDATLEGGRPCLINAEGIAAISFYAKSDYSNEQVWVAYANGAIDRLINYSNSDQKFDLEDIAAKAAAAGVELLRDESGKVFSPAAAVYVKYCPTDGPQGTPQLAIGVLAAEEEMYINGTEAELKAITAKITAGRPFMVADLEKTSYTNAANPTQVYVDTSAIKMIRDQAYTVDIRFDTFRPRLNLNVNIKAGIRDLDGSATEAFKAALEKQKEIERASLKPLAIALGRSCPQLLEVHASLDAGKSLLFVAPETIARIEPFPRYWYLNVTLKSKVVGHDGELVQVDCGSEVAMKAALAALAAPAKPAAAVKPAQNKPQP